MQCNSCAFCEGGTKGASSVYVVFSLLGTLGVGVEYTPVDLRALPISLAEPLVRAFEMPVTKKASVGGERRGVRGSLSRCEEHNEKTSSDHYAGETSNLLPKYKMDVLYAHRYNMISFTLIFVSKAGDIPHQSRSRRKASAPANPTQKLRHLSHRLPYLAICG